MEKEDVLPSSGISVQASRIFGKLPSEIEDSPLQRCGLRANGRIVLGEDDLPTEEEKRRPFSLARSQDPLGEDRSLPPSRTLSLSLSLATEDEQRPIRVKEEPTAASPSLALLRSAPLLSSPSPAAISTITTHEQSDLLLLPPSSARTDAATFPEESVRVLGEMFSEAA